MLLVSALVAVVVAGVLVALCVQALFAADRALIAGERAVRRRRAWANERTIFLSTRSRIAEGVQAGTDAVVLGSAVTRRGHRAIAAIPFGILRAIPATRESSRRIQAAHDETAERVYDTIETISSRIAEGVRRRLTGEGQLPRELPEPGVEPGAEGVMEGELAGEVEDDAEPTQVIEVSWDDDR